MEKKLFRKATVFLFPPNSVILSVFLSIKKSLRPTHQLAVSWYFKKVVIAHVFSSRTCAVLLSAMTYYSTYLVQLLSYASSSSATFLTLNHFNMLIEILFTWFFTRFRVKNVYLPIIFRTFYHIVTIFGCFALSSLTAFLIKYMS